MPSRSRSTPAAHARTAEVVIRRRTAAVAAAAATLALAWAGAATWYIASRDELAQRFFAHQTELRYAYEDRIGELKGRLEREVTLALVERTAFERRAGDLARRQGEIEARQTWLRSFAERSQGTRARPAGKAASKPSAEVPAGPTLPDAKPSPLAEPFSLRLGGVDRHPHDGSPGAAEPHRPPDRLSLIERALERMAGEETRVVEALRLETDGRLALVRAALAATGLDPDRLVDGLPPATGGPLVPLPEAERALPFALLAAEVDARATELLRLQSAARTLPLARPVAGDADTTSGFGYRMDPFTRTPALHTGLDFRAEAGAPVQAGGAGRVVAAEPSGGYGHMIEIDHGAGVTTRYGHLSSYAVSAGDRVEPGQLIGRAGSTGRSTGPHLHYETRINGEPVNPGRFLEAGRMLAGVASN